MKTENEIRTEILSEVIEIIHAKQKILQDSVVGEAIDKALYELEFKIKSMPPKEKPIDWSKASDEELRKEAEKYVGKKVHPIYIETQEVHFIEKISEIDSQKNVWALSDKTTLFLLFSKTFGPKWAEIIEQPVIRENSPDIQEQFEKANPDATFSEPAQEIKAQDLVEGSNNDIDWIECTWTGGLTTARAFICQLIDTSGGSVRHLRVFSKIRKPIQKT